MSFLNRMAVTFFCVLLVMWVITLISPRKEPFVIKQNTDMELHSSTGAKIGGVIVVLITIMLYIVFR